VKRGTLINWHASASDSTPERAIVHLHGVDGPISEQRHIRHLGRGLMEIWHADDHPWEDDVTIPVCVRQLKGGKACRRGPLTESNPRPLPPT